jgi:hypothetical protein
MVFRNVNNGANPNLALAHIRRVTCVNCVNYVNYVNCVNCVSLCQMRRENQN